MIYSTQALSWLSCKALNYNTPQPAKQGVDFHKQICGVIELMKKKQM